MTDKAKAARAEYMRAYRRTDRGAERTRAAQERYWTRRAEKQEEANKHDKDRH